MTSTGTPPRLFATMGPCPPPHVRHSPKIAPSPSIDRCREVLQSAQLVGSLLGDAEDLGDIDQVQEFPACHGDVLSG